MASCPGLDGRSQSVLAEIVDGMAEEGRPKRKAGLLAVEIMPCSSLCRAHLSVSSVLTLSRVVVSLWCVHLF